MLRNDFVVMRIFFGLCLMLSASASCQEKQTRAETVAYPNPDSVLIVYLSRTNNTKAIAEIIQRSMGGTIVALELETPYPEDYKAIVDQVANENATGFLPALKTKVSIEKYDLIFLGFPTWGMHLPPPIKSFLHQHDLEEKTIVPFNTNAGYGPGSSFDEVKELCPSSTILEGFSTKGGVEKDGIHFVFEGERKKKAELEVWKWLRKVNLIK